MRPQGVDCVKPPSFPLVLCVCVCYLSFHKYPIMRGQSMIKMQVNYTHKLRLVISISIRCGNNIHKEKVYYLGLMISNIFFIKKIIYF